MSRRYRHLWLCLALLAGVAGAGGCGDSEPPQSDNSTGGGAQGEPGSAAGADRDRAKPALPAPEARDKPREAGEPPEAGRVTRRRIGDRIVRTKKLPNGVEIILPAGPSDGAAATATCGRRRGEAFEPPVPHLEARRVGDVVVTSFSFRSMPKRCIPATLELRLGSTNDPSPGEGSTVRVTARSGSAKLKIPPDIEPNVVGGKARTAAGVPGKTAIVAIR